ncbi:IS3 family transposase [Rhodocytophaga rosea]|uniref:IS3 family transposase n=1 Tax=Rhodocytophaga rosea TaxID=2704465 RepID=A0A6C0GGQ3_9BACT|nr:IS3 family transposase [Rhodocytophaga rosea]
MFKTLKTALVYHMDHATKQQARLTIFEYIDG